MGAVSMVINRRWLDGNKWALRREPLGMGRGETHLALERYYDAVVIGAGIIGCATAYHLAGAGFRVAILAKGAVAGEASSAAAGMLAPVSDELPDHEHP